MDRRTSFGAVTAVGLAVLALLACDEKKEGAAGAASATPTASAAPAATETATPTVTASAAPSASSAFASAGAALVTGDGKDVVLTMKDPAKEPEHTIKVPAGGSLTVFLPDHPGTVWSIDTSDRTLGKPKEEVIPGFAPGTNGHQFKWPLNTPVIKAGVKHKVVFANKKAGDKTAKPNATFTLTVDVT
jgi:hypothetical protein